MEEEIKQDGFPTAAVDHQIRARLKEIIETSERQYKKILDQLPYGILELDVDMNIIYTNEVGQKYLGKKSEGEAFLDNISIDKQSKRRFEKYLQEIQKSDKEILTCLLQLEAGTVKYLEITATPQKDEQGNLSGYIILIEDETPYADLIEKKETIESPPDCIVTINKTGEIYGVNPAFYAFFESEVANDDTKGKSLLDYFGIQNTERIINIAIPSACDHGAHIWTGEMILKNIPVMIILTIDESSGISLIIQDISERKLLEEKALELSKLAGVLEVCGAVCHEVNQPLQGIFGYLDLIDIDKNLPEPLKQKLKIIRNSANRISTLTRQLLSITRKKSYRTMNYPVSKGSIQIVDIPNS